MFLILGVFSLGIAFLLAGINNLLHPAINATILWVIGDRIITTLIPTIGGSMLFGLGLYGIIRKAALDALKEHKG